MAEKCRHNIPTMYDVCAFVLKTCISKEVCWHKKKCLLQEGPAWWAMYPVASNQPASGSAPTPQGETVTMTQALSAKEDWEILLKIKLCAAPNHVLLVISLGYPRILSSLIYLHISQAFIEGRIENLFFILEDGWIPGSSTRKSVGNIALW